MCRSGTGWPARSPWGVEEARRAGRLPAIRAGGPAAKARVLGDLHLVPRVGSVTAGARYRHLGTDHGVVARLPTDVVARYRAVDREAIPAPSAVVDTPVHL